LNNSNEYESNNGYDAIEPRYLMQPKKKYNLAGIDSNVEKLRGDQIHELTKFLISLKSEYDELIRDTLKKKKETEEVVKQIDMLEKIDIKKNEKINDLDVHLVDIKKANRNKES